MSTDLSRVFMGVAGDDKKISADNAGTVARKLGYVPSKSQIRAIESRGPLTESQISEWLTTLPHIDDVREGDLRGVFTYMDAKGDGRVPTGVFFKMMETVGEPLNEEEMQKVKTTFCKEDETSIDYVEMIRGIMGKKAD
eukprot:GHVO01069366.1.p1 GENE.GHVO01069366.1~~GHVO01069366.1.p1  ORF type:complete len:153 (+),score=38.49 GHVO01069366.1:44-460(+)